MKYKVGDKVMVKSPLTVNYDGDKLYGDHYKRSYEGRVYEIEDITHGFYVINKNYFTDEMLEPAVKTLDNLEVGDVLKHDGNYVKVQGITGNIVFISRSSPYTDEADSFTKAAFEDSFMFSSINELKRKGYKVKQPVEEKLELTLKEIAEKFGKDVKDIKIKK